MKGEHRNQWWRRTPMIVSLLGLLSVALLVWVDQLSLRQQKHHAMIDAVQDLRIHSATSHLWLEEVIADQGSEIEKVWAEYDKAVRLSEALLNGGDTEDGFRIQPLQTPALRTRAEDIRRLLGEYEKNARERFARPEFASVGSPLENLTDEIFFDLQKLAEEIESFLEKRQAADHVQSRQLVGAIFFVWVVFVAATTIRLAGREHERMRAEAALQGAREELEGRVSERTKELRNLNIQLFQELRERQKAEESLKTSQEELRNLSSRLLTAQETERKRISAELHDHLGHSLALLKLRLGQTRRECQVACIQCQTTSTEECQKHSQFIDQVIEDVRRISRDLSPSILEDMGLSAALRWLVENYVGDQETQVVHSIGDVDHLFPKTVHILVYRIMQEALTNATKHAEANRVHLAVKRHVDWLSFVVEDDGKGFDPTEASMRNGSDRGLGLATMNERARMLGGTLTVWSEVGRGTRISLAVPLKTNGDNGDG